MVVCSCPAVVEVTIVRPDLKYQLGFSVQNGMVSQLALGLFISPANGIINGMYVESGVKLLSPE